VTSNIGGGGRINQVRPEHILVLSWPEEDPADGAQVRISFSCLWAVHVKEDVAPQQGSTITHNFVSTWLCQLVVPEARLQDLQLDGAFKSSWHKNVFLLK
jgi:hypothetical protein